MKKLIFTSLFMCLATMVVAQKYTTKTGIASFYSHAPLEDIEAKNVKCGTQFITSSNDIRVVIPIKGFIFDKSLMQAHFNENYLESDKFPFALFNGRITDSTQYNIATPGEYSVTAQGSLLIHGVKMEREIPCKFTVAAEGKSINVDCEFMVVLKDHDIKIPSAVGKNLAEEIKVSYHATLDRVQ